jgi:hypothetical protein
MRHRRRNLFQPQRYEHVMPIALQKYLIWRTFLKANKDHYGDPEELREIEFDWEDVLDPQMTLPENIESLEGYYKKYRWRMPEKEHRVRQCWQLVDSRKSLDIYEMEVRIKPQKVWAKGKQYMVGRIQVTTDSKWIGCRAKITAFVRKQG